MIASIKLFPFRPITTVPYYMFWRYRSIFLRVMCINVYRSATQVVYFQEALVYVFSCQASITIPSGGQHAVTEVKKINSVIIDSVRLVCDCILSPLLHFSSPKNSDTIVRHFHMAPWPPFIIWLGLKRENSS